MVWQQTEFVPNSGLSADTFLEAPLQSVTLSESQALVKLGDDNYGATVMLRKEGPVYVIDEIKLIAGPAESDRMEVKRTLRTLLATGKAVRPTPLGQEVRVAAPAGKPSAVQQAVYTEFAEEPIDIGPVNASRKRLP